MDIGKILEQRDKALDELRGALGDMKRVRVDKAMLARAPEVRIARVETLKARIVLIEAKRKAAIARADSEIAAIREEIGAVEDSIKDYRDILAKAEGGKQGRAVPTKKRQPAKRAAKGSGQKRSSD